MVLAYPASQPQEPLQPQDHSQGYQFDPLLHLPGISPYFDTVGFGLEHKAPDGCEVTAASYIIRHASIYGNDDEYQTYIRPFLWKLEQHRQGWSGPLEFMEKWHSPILEDRLEDITPSGLEDATKVGSHLLQRYPKLAPTVKRILADKKPEPTTLLEPWSRLFRKHRMLRWFASCTIRTAVWMPWSLTNPVQPSTKSQEKTKWQSLSIIMPSPSPHASTLSRHLNSVIMMLLACRVFVAMNRPSGANVAHCAKSSPTPSGCRMNTLGI